MGRHEITHNTHILSLNIVGLLFEAVTHLCLIDQLAGSDTNKAAIVEKGGMDRLIKLAARFADDPSVLQEVRLRTYNSCKVSLSKIVLNHAAPSKITYSRPVSCYEL